MNGDFKISDVKVLPLGIFDFEHSSRCTGHTVCGLFVDEDGTFKLPCYLGLQPKGCTRDPAIVHDNADLVIALETRDGEWFWMHISDYSNASDGGTDVGRSADSIVVRQFFRDGWGRAKRHLKPPYLQSTEDRVCRRWDIANQRVAESMRELDLYNAQEHRQSEAASGASAGFHTPPEAKKW